MARPRKVKVDTNELTNDVKSHKDFVITQIYDPTSYPERVLEAYSAEELNKFLGNGWLIYEGQNYA